jgi:hypothetical protein
MGVEPHIPMQAPQPLPTPRQPLATLNLKPSIQLLGGLDSAEIKTFHYAQPTIVWQVLNAQNVDWAASPVEIKLAADNAPSSDWFTPATVSSLSGRPNAPRSLLLKERSGSLLTKDHPYSVTLRQTLSNGTVLEKTFSIKIEKPISSDVLRWLAILSALSAIVIFVVAWRSLREKPMLS